MKYFLKTVLICFLSQISIRNTIWCLTLGNYFSLYRTSIRRRQTLELKGRIMFPLVFPVPCPCFTMLLSLLALCSSYFTLSFNLLGAFDNLLKAMNYEVSLQKTTCEFAYQILLTISGGSQISPRIRISTPYTHSGDLMLSCSEVIIYMLIIPKSVFCPDFSARTLQPSV